MAAPTLNYAATENTWGMFRALRSRNYRLFFIGQTISLVGTFLTQIATVWLIYRLTGSALLLGAVAFAGQIPLFFLAPFGGVWVDRWNKRRLLVVTQILSGLQSLALALLTLTNIQVWEVIALAVIQGLINSFDMPGRQAFTVELVEDRADLSNAIALNSTMVHAARFVGPASGGLLIYYFGIGPCFAIDSISYIAVVASLLMMRVKAHQPKERTQTVLQELREGVFYVWNSVPIRVILLLMAVLSLTGIPAYNILMPIFADALAPHSAVAASAPPANAVASLTNNHGAQMLGILQGVSGAGALCCAFYLASRRSVVGLGRVIALAGIALGGSIIAFGSSRHLWLSLLIAPIVGFAMLAVFASANTLLQTLADDDKRGRVMSLFTVAFLGMAPFGNLLAGLIATHYGGGIEGASQTVMIAGVIVLVAIAFFAAMLPFIRKLVRPIYVQKGIIREVATGLEMEEAEHG
jgi:MFS family permease